jgi:hypothetical protein
MILKVIATGRQFGDKKDAIEQRVTVGGVKCVVKELDAWEGPEVAGASGQYFRHTWLETDAAVRDDRRERGA